MTEVKRSKKWSLGWKSFLKVSIAGTVAISATFMFNFIDDRYIDKRTVGGGSYHLSINVTPDTVYVEPSQVSTPSPDSLPQSSDEPPSALPDSIRIERRGSIWDIYWRPGHTD